MAFELGHILGLRTILLSSALMVGCVMGCAVHDANDDAPTVLHHEDHGHDAKPAGKPATQATGGDAGAAAAPAPAACANTFDAIQATIFDSKTYSCASAACHGTAGGHIDLRQGFAYDSLLGTGEHDHGEHDHGDGDAAHDEAGHTHPDGEGHALIADGDFDVLHHEDHVHEGEEGGHGHGAHVIAGKPEQSVLYDNLRAKVEGIPTKLGGTPMPLGPTPITREQLRAVELWITAGAPRTGFVAGTQAVCPKPAAAADAGPRGSDGLQTLNR